MSLNATGFYESGDWDLRPKASLFYGSFDVEDFTIDDITTAETERFKFGSSNFDYGALRASLEVSRPMVEDNGILEPYGRMGLTYEFQQTNDGQVLTPALTLEELDDIWGAVELGMRRWAENGSFWEISVGHGGIGVSDLEGWRARFSANILF